MNLSWRFVSLWIFRGDWNWQVGVGDKEQRYFLVLLRLVCVCVCQDERDNGRWTFGLTIDQLTEKITISYEWHHSIEFGWVWIPVFILQTPSNGQNKNHFINAILRLLFMFKGFNDLRIEIGSWTPSSDKIWINL